MAFVSRCLLPLSCISLSFFPTFFSFCSFGSNNFSKLFFVVVVMNQPGQPWIISLLVVSLSSASLDAPFLALIESLDEIPAALRVCPSLGRDFCSVSLQLPLCVFPITQTIHLAHPICSLALILKLQFSVSSAGCKINFCY